MVSMKSAGRAAVWAGATAALLATRRLVVAHGETQSRRPVASSQGATKASAGSAWGPTRAGGVPAYWVTAFTTRYGEVSP